MQEIDKRNPIYRKKQLKTTTFSVAIFVAAALIFSGFAGAVVIQGNTTQMNTIIVTTEANADMEYEAKPFNTADQINTGAMPSRGVTCYAANLHSTPDSFVSFDSDVPGTLTYIADNTAADFIAGACWASNQWWGCVYNTADSLVITIDETSGVITNIGQAGVGLNGLAFDGAVMYGCSSTDLYTIDMVTGAATLVGAFGADVSVMIGIACDSGGSMYGEDIGSDKLYSIDTSTGAATELGLLGIDLSYAQDIAMDKDTDTLYSTGYKGSGFGGGALGTLDLSTGVYTLIGNFPIGDLGVPSEIAGFAIPYSYGPGPEHDVGIKSIDSPATGPAFEDMPVEVTVKNYGNNTEIDVPVKVEIFQAATLEYLDIEYVTLAAGTEETVEFADFTPDDWQVAENTDIDYDITAQTIYADDNPANDVKATTVTLSFPYLFDTAVISVDSPATSGDGQTLPVAGTIKNVGQFPSCCYLTNAIIGTLIPTDAWTTVAWSQTNTWIQYAYGDHNYEPRDCGCNDYYAGCYYTQGGYFDTSLYTFSLDLTPAGSSATLQLCEEFQDFAGYGQFGIYVHSGGEPDASGTGSSFYEETLYYMTVDEVPRYGIYQVFSFDPSVYADPSDVYIEFWYTDDNYGNAWGAGIDCVEIPEIGFYEDFEGSTFPPAQYSVAAEYDEDVAAIILDPGEEAQLTWPDWTPDQLATGISVFDKEYRTVITSYNVDDTNPGNDAKFAGFTLDFYHEVLVQSITQPNMGRNPDTFYAFNSYPGDESVWFDSTNPGVLNTIAPNTAPDFMPAGTWADGTWYAGCYAGGLYTVDPTDGTMTLIGGSTPLNGIAYDGSTMYGATSTALYIIDLGTGAETLVGSLGSAGLMIDIAIDQDTGICYGHDITDDSIYTIDLSTGAATLLGSTGLACNYAQGMEFDQDNDVLYLAGYTAQGELYTCDTSSGACTLVGAFEGGAEVTALAIPYSGGPGPGAGWPPIAVWMKPGTAPVEAIVANEGTFGEIGLNCSAEILEFISDPENGSSVYNDSDYPIDLDALGDTHTSTFTSYNFAMEGPYGLYIELPLGTDDFPNNNAKAIGIGIDNTAPTVAYVKDPAVPNGENQWYTSDLTVTFTADDGDDDWDSGVKEIKYRVDGGPVQTIAGFTGSYTHQDDGDDIEIEYWAIDNVDNEGTHLTFDFDMDQTVPDVDIAYEVTGGSALEGWDFVFTATATDDMSGMDRVVFYLNDVEQEVVPGAGPTYQWGFTYYGGLDITIRATAIDDAGLDASDQVVNPESSEYSESLPSNVVTKKVVGLGQI